MSKQIDKIDLSGVKEIPVGAVVQSTINTIEEGTQGEFRNDAYYAAANLTKAEIADAKVKPAVQITTGNGATLVMNLPVAGEDGVTSLHPKSTLSAFKRKYGKAPEVGMEVATQLDAQGFWRVVM